MSTYRTPDGRLQVDAGPLTRRQRRALARAARRRKPARTGRPREIQTEVVYTTIVERPATVEVPVIPADASPELAEGLRRRRVAAIFGRCPCGATRQVTPIGLAAAEQADPARPAGHLPFNHTPDCPGHDTPLSAALAAWQTKQGG